jgi:HEXXH motif-containing protein
MVPRHRISGEAFDALASNRGDPAAIQSLRAAQQSKHLLLLRYIAHAWPGSATEREAALAVLAEAQTRAPDVVAELLGQPLVGAWAAWTTRRLRRRTSSDVPVEVDCGHLGAIAAAAAHRTGIEARLTAYVRHGLVMVPTVGAARLPLPDCRPVSVTTTSGELRLSGGGVGVDVPADPRTAGDGWLPLRRLTGEAGGQRLTVTLDDLDPYRDSHHIPAAGRLSQRRWARWQELFGHAWEMLCRHAPTYAADLPGGLRSLVPLADAGAGPARSATARHAFGTFGLTEPESAADFAITLVHEFQHAKLSALLDFVPLYDASSGETYYAPWRMDPRPIGGLLQGVYAFLGVADVWRLLRADPALRQVAEREFAEVREQVHVALTALTGSGHLTAQGARFAAGVRAKLDALRAVPLPDHVVGRARAALRRNREDWRRRNARAA